MNAKKLFNGIEHVAVAAKDPKALARWYCSTLDFRIAYESTQSLTTFVKLGEDLIEIIEATDVDRVFHGEKDPGFRHIAISVTDIHQAYKDLKAKGILLRSEPLERKGVWAVFFEDPENNLIHLIQRSESL